MDLALSWVSAFAEQGIALFWLLFVLAFANVFVPPVPIETISLFVGYLTGTGYGNPILLGLALIAGMAAGSIVLFYLARSQEHRLLQNKFVSKQVTPARLAQVEKWFNRWGIWTIYLGKLVPGMSFATVLASGLFGLPPRKALTAIFTANALYFAASVALGRAFGERWNTVMEITEQIWPWAAALVVILVTVVILYNWRQKKASKSVK